MNSDSFTAYCPDAVYAADARFQLRVIDRKSEIIGHRSRLATSRAVIDSLSMVPTSIIEGEPESDWIYFNIRKTPHSSLQVNQMALAQGSHALVVMAGGSFVATMPPGYSSYGLGVHKELLQDAEMHWAGGFHPLGSTAIYAIRESLFEKINRELYLIEHGDLDDASLEHRLSDLATTILTCLDPSDEFEKTNRQRIIFASIKYLRSTSARVSTQELAEVAHCSLRTLQYTFRRSYGISPKKFIERYRLSQLRSSLVQSRHKNKARIKDIASVHGFRHQGNLSKAYRELFGETPSETMGRI